MLELKGIKKDYPAGSGVVHALKGIDLRFRKAEFVSILGQSGCGKTTMLNIIGGLLRVDSGSVFLDDKDITKFNKKMLCHYRNNMIGYIFQDYKLIENMSVFDK